MRYFGSVCGPQAPVPTPSVRASGRASWTCSPQGRSCAWPDRATRHHRAATRPARALRRDGHQPRRRRTGQRPPAHILMIAAFGRLDIRRQLLFDRADVAPDEGAAVAVAVVFVGAAAVVGDAVQRLVDIHFHADARQDEPDPDSAAFGGPPSHSRRSCRRPAPCRRPAGRRPSRFSRGGQVADRHANGATFAAAQPRSGRLVDGQGIQAVAKPAGAARRSPPRPPRCQPRLLPRPPNCRHSSAGRGRRSVSDRPRRR